MDRNPTTAQLATIAAQFVAAGEDQEIALTKANALYFAAARYMKRFNAMTPLEQAMDIDDQDAVRELLEPYDLAVGDSEKGSPALAHFRAIAKTKTERDISYKAFINLIERECGAVPEKIAPEALVKLHARLRARRSRARTERRKQKSVK
jgi:hypothetical protein